MKIKGRPLSLYIEDRTKPAPKHGDPKVRSDELKRRGDSFRRQMDFVIASQKVVDHPIAKKFKASIQKRASKSRGKHYTPTNRINMK